MRLLGRQSLYYLLRYILQIRVIEHRWLFERCNELQANPDGYLDLWAREHGKSLLGTLGLNLFDILRSHGRDPDPAYDGEEVTIGIFSHSKTIAKTFLGSIRTAFETDAIRWLYPDIAWSNTKDAPVWSSEAITVRRKRPQREPTVEAWGLVDKMPTGRHYHILDFDDLITEQSVNTAEMIDKTTNAFRLAISLGRRGGVRRMKGTRYHYHDSYHSIITTGAAIPRIYPATDDGTPDGKPVLLTQEELDQKYREMGPAVFATQMLLDPLAAEEQGFLEEWINYYDAPPDDKKLNTYILVDPAGEGHYRRSDYTAIFVIGLGGDGNYYNLQMIRDRINLTARTNLIFDLHAKWKPRDVLYERFGMQSDVPHIRSEMSKRTYHFSIREIGSTKLSKIDRIRRLIPLFEQGRMYFPRRAPYTGADGRTVDLVELFVHEEYKPFPLGKHPDMLDALAQLTDPNVHFLWPKSPDQQPDRYRQRHRRPKTRTGWLAA